MSPSPRSSSSAPSRHPLVWLTIAALALWLWPARAEVEGLERQLAAAVAAEDHGKVRAGLKRLGQASPDEALAALRLHAEAIVALGLETELARGVGALRDPAARKGAVELAGAAGPGARRALFLGLSLLPADEVPEARAVLRAGLEHPDLAVASDAANALSTLRRLSGRSEEVRALVARLERAEARAPEARLAGELQRALASATGEALTPAAAWRAWAEQAPAEEAHGPRVVPMVVLGLIMIAVYVVIAFELAPKSLAALVGAILSVIAGLWFDLFHALPGETAYKYVHHVLEHDLGVLGVIVGTSILVEVAGRSGLFHFIAVKIVKQTRGDPNRLFLFTALLTMVFVTFLTIAPGTLIAVSLLLVVTQALGYPSKPYLVLVAMVANSAALVTFASGVCTLMLGTAGDLAYTDFFRVSTPMALISAALAYWALRRAYRSDLLAPADLAERQQTIAAFDEWALVKDRKVFWRIAAILGFTIAGFAVAQKLGVGLDFVAFAGATAALVFSGESADEAIKKVNWSVIVFFLGLFVVIGSVQASGLLTVLASAIVGLSGGSPMALLLMLSVFVLLVSGVVDNIPVAATLIPVVRAMQEQGVDVTPLWWALVLACNLGGNSTPVGSISTILALTALEKERGEKVGWGEFFKVGLPVYALQSVVAIVYLVVFQFLDLFPRG